MPLILVVDDSLTDRTLIKELLCLEPIDWIVEFAESAEQAILKIESLAVDVIITDMMMPGMSGLELLERVRTQVKPVPVVLVSGQSGDDLALEAVQKGAASYVPKDELAVKLSDTVKQVLAARTTDWSLRDVVDSISAASFRFDLCNNPARIPSVVSFLQQLGCNMHLFDSEGRMRIGVALDEAMLVGMCLGNLELSNQEFLVAKTALHNGATDQVVEQRRASAEYSGRPLTVDVAMSPSQMKLTVGCAGRSFADYLNNDADGQRSMNLIKSMFCEVTLNEAGTAIQLVKNRDQDPATA